MRIKHIGLKNFTVFEDFQLEVSSGINVFIGENGTGKTHLLKALYAACESSKSKNPIDELLKCFKENQQEGNLLRDKNVMQLTISIFSEGVTHGIHHSRQCLNILDAPSFFESKYSIEIPDGKKFSAVYIPVKDMLTHSDGLLAIANKYRDFPFDKTLTDIVVKASQWKIKQPLVCRSIVVPPSRINSFFDYFTTLSSGIEQNQRNDAELISISLKL